MKNLYVLFAVLIVNFCSFQVEGSTKYNSEEIYSYTKQIAEVSSHKVWAGFKPLKFILLEKKSDLNQLKFSVDHNRKNAGVFMTLSDEYFSKNTLENNISITFHEAFHAFQRSPNRTGTKWGYGNAMLIFEYKELSARSNALFSVEAKILHLALMSRNKTQLKDKVREFLKIRAKRHSEMDRRFVEFEKGAELNEGLAEYAGTKAVILGLESTEAKKIRVPFSSLNVESFLKKKYQKLNSVNRVGKNVRLRFYYTGSAQALLLDRLLPNWKNEVQMKGRTLQELLETGVTENKKQEDKINKILSQYKYESVLKDEEKAVLDKRAENLNLLKTALNKKGIKITFDFSSLSSHKNIRFFDPMNVTIIEPNVRVHTRMVNFALGDIFKAKFEQMVVEDLNNKNYISIVPDSHNLEIKIDDKALDLTQNKELDFDKKMKIESEKLKFEISKGIIKVNNNEILVKIEE